MKFESLNNSKYSLTPEKMGKLVGGERIYVSTSACYIKGVKNSGDIASYANQHDKDNNIESGPLYAFDGQGDTDRLNAKLRELQTQK